MFASKNVKPENGKTPVLCVVSSPFQFLCGLQYCRQQRLLGFEASLVTVEAPEASVKWGDLIAWSGDQVARYPRVAPPIGLGLRTRAVWSLLDALRIAQQIQASAPMSQLTYCMGSYSDRVQRVARFLLSSRVARVVVLDDGMDSLQLEEWVAARTENLRDFFKFAPPSPLWFYSAILSDIDERIGTVEEHSFGLVQFDRRFQGLRCFIGQPFLHLRMMPFSLYTRILRMAKRSGVTVYVAHPLDGPREEAAAVAAGLEFRRFGGCAEIELAGAEQITGVISTVLFSAATLGLANSVTAFRLKPSSWGTPADERHAESVYEKFATIGVVIKDVD